MNMEKQAKKLMKSAKSNWDKAKRTYVCRSLKDLIKAYRACTTRSEERALVKKESAHIRDLFREGDKAFRRKNIAKLLFFHMNGYPTDFGMTECIKLCASSKYNDKRVAYLGLMILVDETEEILMLMTNSLKQDLHSNDLQIVSLALNVLGDIASVEMVRDLLPEIEKRLLASNPYIRKKAALAAVRAVRKLEPGETGNILHDVPAVFDIRSPAVHISGAALISALCKQSRSNVSELQVSMTPVLLNMMRDHLLARGRGSSDSTSEPIIGGVRNPFLQVKVIAAIRLLVESDVPGELLESISDVLAQVAANTDGTKIAGCAVLYECVRTITTLNTENSLRALAVNILGKFLSHKEATVRYIALQELTRVVDADGAEVLVNIDGYKEKILAGLREADPTVRKRAVELVYRIANEANVGEMVKELLGYIQKSILPEPKEDACWKIFHLLDRFGPSDEWKVEMFVKTLSAADMSMPEELITSFIALVSSKPHVQGHAVRKLFSEALASNSLDSCSQKGHDPFDSSMRDGTSEQQSPDGSIDSRSQRRKPRLERVALYALGEHGEVTPDVGLEIPEVLDAFERLLCTSSTADEAWMNTHEPAFYVENKILGEVALTGLVKFACRAIAGTDVSAGKQLAENPILAITGTGHPFDSNSGGAVLALTAAPSQQNDVQDLGLGTDLLSSMGLGENKPKGLQNGSSKALVPSSELLATTQDRSGAGALMSLESDTNVESGNPVIDRVRRILLARSKDADLEVQQRACEYLMLLNESMIPTLAATMAPMPPLDFRKIQERARQRKELRSTKSFSGGNKGGGLLVDLLGDMEDTGPKPLALPAVGSDLLALPPSAPPSGGDLTLEDILGNSPGGPSHPAAVHDATPDLSMLGIASQDSATPQAVLDVKKPSVQNSTVCSTSIFESDSLAVVAEFFRDDAANKGNIRAELLFTNKSRSAMKKFVFLLAVPKYIKLQMHPASASEIPVGGQASQSVNLVNSLHGQRPVQLRYRVEYALEASGGVVQQQGVATGLEAL